MYIRSIKKKSNKAGNVYTYYRLCHSYKVGKKTRQQMLLNLGTLKDFPKEKHKMLANRIEELLTGARQTLFEVEKEVEILAQEYSQKIVKKGIFGSKKKESGKSISKEIESDYQEVDINTIEQIESKTIGGEWLVKQAMDKLGLTEILASTGMSENLSMTSQKLLAAKMLHPSSELETERWLDENSGIDELFDVGINQKTTRYMLYKAGEYLYKHRSEIEKKIYNKSQNLFSNKSQIVIYDLTNMYFEGRMLGSEKAAYGRSKEKRSDKKLIGLALAIDSLGFVRYNKIYKGNIGEPQTFKTMLEEVCKELSLEKEKPVIVMDAGIAIEENLDIIREKKYDYVCVSRTKPKDYTKLNEEATKLSDNRGNTIEVTKSTVEGQASHYLHIKSHQKEQKEKSMSDKITQRFEEEMNHLKAGLSEPRRLKKIIKVHEKIGRIKAKYSKISKLYKITYTEDKEKDVITDIKWKKQENKVEPNGEYFLKYSKEILTEKEIWDTYNLTRDVEATFRCLKTDLNIRPIHHQKDKYIEIHLWLGIMAYQIVNYIRQKLKQQHINYSWTTIVNKTQAQQLSFQEVQRKKGGKIFIKLITRPNKDVKSIFSALNFKSRPFVRKTKVVTQL